MTTRPLLEPLPPGEHLSEDDLAARQGEEFLADCLAAQRMRANAAPVTRGVCINCGSRCLPRAVYCDADCRDDHEARVAARARLGSA